MDYKYLLYKNKHIEGIKSSKRPLNKFSAMRTPPQRKFEKSTLFKKIKKNTKNCF